jgi:hypothetical protein
MMKTLVLGVLAGLACDGAMAASTTGPLSFRISTNKTVYVSKEPVQLGLQFTNTSDSAVTQQLYLACSLTISDCKLSIYYRRAGSTFRRFIPMEEELRADGMVLPTRLEPGRSIGVFNLLLFDWSQKQFVVDEPGTYEFKAIHMESDPVKKLESNVVRVRVDAPPPSERDAAKLFGDIELMRFLQQPGGYVGAYRSDKAVGIASQIVERYPDTPYATAVRAPLLGVLTEKVFAHTASAEEKQLLEQLKASGGDDDDPDHCGHPERHHHDGDDHHGDDDHHGVDRDGGHQH